MSCCILIAHMAILTHGLLFTKNMQSYWYRDSHYKPETVVRPSQVYNGDSHTHKTTCFKWIEALSFTLIHVLYHVLQGARIAMSLCRPSVGVTAHWPRCETVSSLAGPSLRHHTTSLSKHWSYVPEANTVGVINSTGENQEEIKKSMIDLSSV